MGKFGDIDAAKAKADLNARVKAMLMLLFQMFSGARQNTANKIHNFIPHLKRTDRDCGSLPFFSKTFTSHKTNKEHILLSMISMVVQTYWDRVDDNKILELKLIEEFDATLLVLEEISKSNIDNFGVYPVSSLHFSLMSKENLDRLEVEAAKKERAEAERKEDEEQQGRKDEAEGKQLMEAELGSGDSTSQDSDSTDVAETEDVPPVSESTESTSKDGDSENTEEEESPAIPSAPEASSEKTAQPKLVEDQVSTEDADACDGDCDNCDNLGCQKVEDSCRTDEPEREDNLEGAEVGGIGIAGSLADEQGGIVIPKDAIEAAADDVDGDGQPNPADSEAGGAADSEPYPDREPLEQTIADAIPPMPEEEKLTSPPMPGADQEDDDSVDDDDGSHGTSVVEI